MRRLRGWSHATTPNLLLAGAHLLKTTAVHADERIGLPAATAPLCTLLNPVRKIRNEQQTHPSCRVFERKSMGPLARSPTHPDNACRISDGKVNQVTALIAVYSVAGRNATWVSYGVVATCSEQGWLRTATERHLTVCLGKNARRAESDS